jgi:hypothetical protein
VNHWIRPSCDSRTGASHLRRAVPCQDASGFAGFRDAAGTPIQVLVVSDGHGGSRYVRSDVGARLACEVAMRELQQGLAPARLADDGALEEWRGWLAEELPARIVAAWLGEVERHWRADPGAEGGGFTPLLYGATLGVLLLTPFWWAHTGLGDWDLVRIEAAGGEVLLSEEPEQEAAGEATFSLCLERAERHFAPRTALMPLTAEAPPFALLLGSDGLRKSCGSDADFLTLCRYLVGLSSNGGQAGAAELAEALDHISRQGSGDDISVAVARWAPLSQGAAWPEPGGNPPARVVQPLPGSPTGLPHTAVAAAPAAAAPAAVAMAAEAAMAVTEPFEPASGASGEPPSPGSPPAPPRSSHALGSAPAGSQPAAGGRPRRHGRHGARRPVRVLAVATALLGLGGVGLLIAASRGLGPFARRLEPSPFALTSQQRRDLQRQVAALCGQVAAPNGTPDHGGAATDANTVSGRHADAARTGSTAVAPGTGQPGALGSVASGVGLPHGPGTVAATATALGRPPSGPAPQLQAAEGRTAVRPTSGGASAARSPAASTASPVGVAAASAPGEATVVTPSSDPRTQQRIAATLASRASVFQQLDRGDPAQTKAVLGRSHADSLNALIALSALDPTLRPSAAAADRPGWLRELSGRSAGLLPFPPHPGASASAPVSPLAELGTCPELTQALRAAWQRPAPRGAAAPVHASSPPAVPVPEAAGGRSPASAEGSDPAGPLRKGAASRSQAPERGSPSR